MLYPEIVHTILHPAGLGMKYNRIYNAESPAIVGFLDGNYRYKSVATQIPDDILR